MPVKFKKPNLKNIDAAGNKAGIRAINRTLTTMRKEAQQEVQKEIKLKSTDIKATIVISKATSSNGRGILSVIRKGVELFKYGARRKVVRTPRGKRYGVTVQVKGQRKLVEGGFIATMRNGKTGVFRRGPKSGGYVKDASRFPIRQLFSTSVANLLSGDNILSRICDRALQVFKLNFDREMKYEISKFNKSGE